MSEDASKSDARPTSPQVAIPEALRRQLDDFRRQLWRIKVIEAIAAGLIGLLLSFLLVFGIDRMTPTSGWLRLGLLLAGFSLFAGFAPYWIHRWIWRRRRQNQLARLIAQRYPGLGDRLLGVIELQSQEGNEDSLSPRLREAAMAAVAAESEKRDFYGAMPTPRHRRWSLIAFVLLGISTVILTFTPQAGLNALQRWLLPLSDTERYTFTKLENPPKYLAVPYGESFTIKLTLAKDSERTPDTATARYALQPTLTSERKKRSYTFEFPGQQSKGTVVFRLGDLRHEMLVEPLERPHVEDVWATITPPDYLGLPERRIDLFTGSLSAVEGSKLQFGLRTNRPLVKTSSYGPITYTSTDTLTGEVQRESSGDKQKLKLEGREAHTEIFKIGTRDFEIPFAWTDRNGLKGESGFKLRVDAMEDAAPHCYLQGINRQHIMLPEETIEFELLAEDDFGIMNNGIEWVGQFSRPTGRTPAKGGLDLEPGQPGQSRYTKPVSFSPKAFGIEPQKLMLRGWTTDHLPGRARSYSEPVTIYVLTRDEHAQLLKHRFDRQITELEDLARRELNLLEENQRLERLDGEKLQSDENRKRLAEQAREEAETRRRTQKLSEDMEQLLKDAVRNGDIDKETMRKMAESMQNLKELAQEDVPEIQKQLDQAGDPSNTPQKSESEMKKATEQQEEVVKKMQETVEKANEAKQNFEAGTFIKRLRKAASEQKGITASLVREMTGAFTERGGLDMLGQDPEQIDPSANTLYDQNIRQQSNTSTDVRWIMEDLAHYNARTKKPDFQAVLKAMEEAQVIAQLEEIRNQLTSKHTYEPAEASKIWG
ncbi:MAG: hypothetical protein R3242_08350, partial [Akkermansiaceae bacterium]|nr:hypothetical protein [Akkermansiaceae bacterium]